MSYAKLAEGNANETEKRTHLVGGDTVAVTIRIPANLRDAAKEEAALRGTSFSALLRESLIDELTRGR